MKIYRCLVALVLICLANYIFSQPINTQVKDAIMPSPEAASLGKFEEIPIDFAHGLANISVPIYQLQHGPLSIPISLRYHSSGIRVREISSWCGTSWNLEGQYMLSRTVQGLADDLVGGYYLIGDSLNLNDVNHRREIALGERDGESDIYSYAIPGYSGKFYLDEFQTPQSVPKTDLNIEIIHDNNRFEGFILTDPNGTKYYFGYINSTDKGYVEITIPDTEDTNLYRSGWYLARVESFDGVYQINYSYEDNYNYQYEQLSSCRIVNYHSNDCYGSGEINSCQTTSSFLVDIEGKKLKTITSPTTTISFKANTNRLDLLGGGIDENGKSLDTIRIETGEYCKEFVLGYDYFEDTNITGPESYRLKLDKIQEQSCTGDTLPAYRFDYYGSIINGKPFFINRYSRQIDAWGFYNGKTNNELTGVINIPPTTINFNGNPLTKGASDRSTDFNYMVYGALKTVYNSLGGRIDLVYDANSYPGIIDGSNTVAFQLASCVNLASGCCMEKMMFDSITFNNQSEISDGSYDLFLSPSCVNPDENFFDIQLKVYAKENGAWVYKTETSFNQEITDDYTLPKEPLSSLFNFQVGVEYKFEVITNDAYGRFRIYNQPQYSGNIEVGGLRIRKITYHDGMSSSNDIVREYFYSKTQGDTLSSGILVKKPIFAYTMQGQALEGTTMDDFELGVHSEESLIPLSSFQGAHISYTRVEEVRPDNGKTVYLYDAIYAGIDKSYPAPPIYYQKNAGSLSESFVYKQDNTVVQHKKITPTNLNSFNYSYGPTFLKTALVHSIPDGCGGTSLSVPIYLIAPTEYDIRSSIYLVEKEEFIQDGVSTITNYEYDDFQRHFFPTATFFTNSDGSLFRTEMSYPVDDSLLFGTHSYIYDSMVVRNQIATPIQTIEKVDGLITKGNRIIFNAFDPSSGGPGIPNNFNAYPNQFFNYEMAWDKNGNIINNNWVLDGLISDYDPITARPKAFSKIGWLTENYTWNPINGLIQTRKFKDFIWSYEYYPNTLMLKTEIAIDSQKTHYHYDQFMRLEKIRSRNDNVITTYDYHFKQGTNSHNYVHTNTTFGTPDNSNSSLQQINHRTYFDGLGRTIQQVQGKHSSNHFDIITAISYDNQGRVHRQFEPFESLYNDSRLNTDTSARAYTLTEYEKSPLNRPIKTTPPNWYPTITTYGHNTFSQLVRDFENTSFYLDKALSRQTIIDPNGNQTINYTDKRGRQILTRKVNSNGGSPNNTYYLYNAKDQIIKILPPGTELNQTADSNLVFTYLYDPESRVIEKKIPDAAKIEYVYNNRDLATGMKNGNLRNDQRWMVTKYDDYGRIISTGLLEDANFSNSDTLNPDSLWSETFYDGFNGSSTINLPQYIGRVRKKNTYILKGNDRTGQILASVYNYDQYGRNTFNNSQHHLNGINLTSYEFDFADNLLKEDRNHLLPGQPSMHFISDLHFDSVGRLRDTYHSIYNNQKHISQLNYTAKDEISSKHLGAVTNGFLQEINYTYLPNGFLSSINPSLNSNDLFQLHINYDQAVPGLVNTAQKNGNITQLRWKVQGEAEQTYGYLYDYLDRLTNATYGSNNNAYGTEYSYDERGNFINITRRGVYSDGNSFQSQQIDNMAFTPYAGTNKIKTITDTAPCPENKMIHQALDNTAIHAVDSLIIADNVVNNNAAIVYQAGSSISLKAGFSANAGTDFVAKIADCPQSGYETDGFTQRSNNEYLYDPNGNQTKDPNKGIITEYNYLNLPFKTTFDNGNIIEWLYLADGTKLQKTVKRNGLANPILKQDYIGNIEYVNDTLDAVYLQDAKAAFNSGIFLEYQYYLSDHLGNNRVLFADSNGDGSIDVNTEILQTSDYYPFGLQMEGNYIQNTEREDRYKFNGMERNIDFGVGLDMAKYRTYDPAIGRWLQIDPDAEQFYSLTPYNNNFNNPIRFDDPDGDNPIKLLKAAYNVGKRAYKTYKKTGKLNAKSIGNAVKDEVFSIVDNVSTIFDSESSTGDKVLAAFDLVTGFGGEAKATGKTLGLLDDAKDAKKAEGFADDTKVVRGGTCKCEQFENGSGVTVGTDGKLDGVSVNSAPGKSVSELSEGIKNGQVGVTTVGDVKKAGGNITPSPNDRNPNHATLSGITGKQAEELFNPTIKNPSKNK